MVGQLAPGARLDGSFVPGHVSGIVAVAVDGEAVLVDEVTTGLHLLNPSAALLWACFDGVTPVTEIAFDLAEVLAAPFEQILADTLVAVADLLARGVVYDGRSPAPARLGDGGLDSVLDVPRRPRLLDEPPNG